jgi:hypothetical protein
MCCFSSKTDVSQTTLFARIVRPGTQVVVYQMRYTAKEPTAMILPVPVRLPAREDSVRFKSLKGYPNFFEHLERGFPEKRTFSLSGSKGVPATQVAAAPLAVHDVGDFVASFVPSAADFGRIDPRFVLSKDIWDKVPSIQGFGFAVFQLKELSGSPHPIAFEVDTKLDGTLFFPTLHIHDGTVHESDDFDHALYLQEPELDARVSGYDGPDAKDEHTGLVRSDRAAKDFVETGRTEGLVNPDLLIHKLTMRGTLPNRDTFFDLKKIATSPRGCSRCDTTGSGLPLDVPLHVGLTMAGFSWIVRRRDALRRPKD